VKVGSTRRRNIPTPLQLAGLALLVTTGVFHVAVSRPAEQRLAALEQTLRERAVTIPFMPVQAGARDTAQRLASFYAFFDQKLTFTDWLARFFDLAERAGVEPQAVEYRRAPREDVPLVLYEVSVPISGDYGKIRSFTEGVLNALPIVSLDHASFRRQRPNQEIVDAELRFTFYLPASPTRQ
jgi:hypothetical protein